MIRIKKGRSIDTIFVLIVFSIFAFSILMVLMLGAGIYRNIHDISRTGEDERTAFSYIRTKTRTSDNYESISVGEFGGSSALFIYETIGERQFRTVIFKRDGWLNELFADATLDLPPTVAMRVTPIDYIRFEETEHGLIMVSTENLSLLLSPRSGSERSVVQ
ncbi:MAG: DUF4860 domain-containing protein [Oscillospiraceae bacterium]|nr:DUF4860 domain-containing protein [Oscillospiraceae bacterium]MCL2278059.1 DUF4860 domain-containing protein [Oscillospiraceae bacterium]